jgi:hypothetical protein
MDAGERLRIWWKATGASVPTRPTPEAEIAALEQRYGVTLPEEFRHFLLGGAPAEDNHMDEMNGTWWPVDCIRNVPDEYETPLQDSRIEANAGKYLIFADYMIWCWAWAICCSDDEDRGRIAVIGGSPDRIIADSFGEFVGRYIEDSASLM